MRSGTAPLAGWRRAFVVAGIALSVVLSGAVAACGDATATPPPSVAQDAGELALDALAHGTRSERAAAADTLAALGDRTAVPALIEALGDESWSVRARVVVALGSLGDPRALDALLGLLEAAPTSPPIDEADIDDAERAFRAAIDALGAIGDPRAVSRLLAIALDDADVVAGYAASQAIEAIGGEAAPSLAEAIATLPAAKAADAVAILASLGAPALDPLVALLQDARPAVRSAAASALGDFGAAAVRPLVGVLDDADRDLRGAAARSLGKIGDPSATSGLVKLLADAKNVSPATWALAKIHAADGTPLVKYLSSKSTVGVYRALIRIGQENTVSALLKALRTFGTKTMAEAYLNCGNPTLEKAGRTWAADHGYSVVTRPGAGEETWGGG